MLKKQKQNARKTENNIVHNFKFHSQVVLSSSSKYFKDFFRHQPGVNIIDLDKVDKEPSPVPNIYSPGNCKKYFAILMTKFCPKELAPNDISLTLEDVQLIIGILYCVGTVEISPQRIETLLICAQVDSCKIVPSSSNI